MFISYFRNRRARKALKREEARKSILEMLEEGRAKLKLSPNWVDDLFLLRKSDLIPTLLKLEGLTLADIGSDEHEMKRFATPRSEEGKEAIAA